MTRNTTLREKGQALFLAALMVLSVFAMSAAFAGAAAADHDPNTEVALNEGDRLYQGQTGIVTVSDVVTLNESNQVPEDTIVDLYSASSEDAEDDDWEREWEIEAGTSGDETIEIDTSGRSAGSYHLAGDNTLNFNIRVQTLTADFDDESVTNAEGSSTTLTIDSKRASFQTEVSADGLDHEDLQQIFGEEVVSVHEDDNVVVLENRGDFTASFADIEAGEYEFVFEAADTDAEANATIEVTEAADATAQFDSSTYSQEAGDVVEFTVQMESTEDSVVKIIEDDGNYQAELVVEDGADGEADGEVTIKFNTYYAGQDEYAKAFSAADSEDSVNVRDSAESDDADEYDGEKAETTIGSEYRLLPADFTLELHVENSEVDLATLVLHEQKSPVGTATTGIAKQGSLNDESTPDEITEAAIQRENVAMDDIVVVQVDASGIFGYLADDENSVEAVPEEGDADGLTLQIKQTNPDKYQSPNEIPPDAVDVIPDADNKRLFLVIDTSSDAVDVEADQEYDVTFNVTEAFNEPYDRDEQSATSSFSVEERSISIDGVKDKQEHLVVAPSKEATISGQSNAAPGTEVQVRVRATGKSPFLMTADAEVDEDGHFHTTFDFSDQPEGQEFTINAYERDNRDVETGKIDAIFGTSAEQPDTHSLTVSVVDEDGNAIPGASVTVDGDSATTNVKGQTAFDLADGEYTVSASADGYEDGDSKVTIDGDDADVTVTLTADEDKKGADDDDGSAGADDDSSADDSSAGDDDSTDGDEDQPGFGVIVALVALLAAAGLALRRQ